MPLANTSLSASHVSPPFTHDDERGEAQLFDSARRQERLHVPQRRPVLPGSAHRHQPEEGVHLRDAPQRGDRRDTGPVRGCEEHLHAEGRPQGGLLGEPEDWGAVRCSWQGEVQKARVSEMFVFLFFFYINNSKVSLFKTVIELLPVARPNFKVSQFIDQLSGRRVGRALGFYKFLQLFILFIFHY